MSHLVFTLQCKGFQQSKLNMKKANFEKNKIAAICAYYHHNQHLSSSRSVDEIVSALNITE